MNLIVIEGLDGAGKSTQIELLRAYFESEGKESNYLHFPRNDAPFFGELVSRFLRGEFGKLEDVDPYLVAMIYAGDRMDASNLIKSWLDKGHYVILDRYVYSNIAYQCAKIESSKESERLKEWILKLEFSHFGIPQPGLNIFLDVPFSFTEEKLMGARAGADRDYLNGRTDIHENSLTFQKEVRDIYIKTAESDKKLVILNCSNDSGGILTPVEIFSRVLELLKQKNIIE